MERKTNRKDDYRLLVALYGYPDSLYSSEKEGPRPKIPTRLARYHVADVTVAFVPHGCEEAYDLGMRALAGSGQRPRVELSN
jgi:hypothetical protein